MVTNKYSKLMSLKTESAASALPIRTYEIDVDFSMYPTTPKKTDIIYINGDTNSSIIKARLLMGDKPVNLFGKMVVMNVREGVGYDNLSILGEVIDIDNAIVSFSLHKNIVNDVGENVFSISIESSDSTLVSHMFSYNVIETIENGTLGSEEQKTILQELITNVEISKSEYAEMVNDGREMFDKINEDITIIDRDIEDVMSMIGGL